MPDICNRQSLIEYGFSTYQWRALLTGEPSLRSTYKVDKTGLQLSGTYCHKTSTRLPSCTMPREPTMYPIGLWYSIRCENAHTFS